MDYKQAYIRLYGAAGTAIEELYKSFVVTQENDNAIKILQAAIAEVEDMDEDSEDRPEQEGASDPPLTPSLQGKDCLGNGEHEGIECCCDECDHYLTCFPQ